MNLLRRAALAAALAAGLFAAGPVLADPISIAILSTISASLAASATAVAITTFVLTTAASFILGKLLAPSQRAQMQQRQASVTTMSLGEGPREALLGQVDTGGTLADAFDYGGDHGTDWEVMVVALADHECAALVGFYVDDLFVAFAADGVVTGFSGLLKVYWRPGTEDQAFPADLAAYSSYDDNDNLAGVAHVWVAYKADAPDSTAPVWSTGRPRFLWRVKGLKLYDPRLDSTVAGGEGLHRWADPSTREWSENAYLCRYNWARGIYACDRVDQPEMLLVGRGLSALEAPPERVAARANICDEAVALKAGGTEKRYICAAVVKADEKFGDVEEMFAACMAGMITQPEGGVEIEPGAARTPTFALTDADYVVGTEATFGYFKSDSQRVNTVVPRYVEPSLRSADHSAPVRRSIDDITADGGPKEQPLSLSFVKSSTQAQRCGQITLRMARLERTGGMTLPPRLASIEAGDWGTYTGRRTRGETVTVRAESDSQGQDWRNVIAIREISAACYDWNPATDEDSDSPTPPPFPPQDFQAAPGAGEADLSAKAPGSVTVAYIKFWRGGVADEFTAAVAISGPLACAPGEVVTYTDTVVAGSYRWWAVAYNSDGKGSSPAGPQSAIVT